MKNIKDEFPMDIYLPSWKLFRCLSDENKETAKHLLLKSNWNMPSNILDIGCGDGLLIKEIVHLCENSVKEVRLLEPDLELLETAFKNLSETNLIPSIVKINNDINSVLKDCFNEIDLILAVHIAYLIPTTDFIQVINSIPINVPFYLVLDEPTSIFSTLWKETAFKYSQRSLKTHEYVKSLDNSEFSVNYSVITSHIKNPLKLRKDIKERIISLLCYNDYNSFTQDKKQLVEKIISDFLINETINCNSSCYEIIRKKKKK